MSNQVNLEHKNAERIFARGFTVLGGVFWVVLAFAGPYVYGGASVLGAVQTAVYPLAFTIAVLILGWFYERLAALILSLAAIGTIAWGMIWGGWEPLVWAIMLVLFVAPTVISAVLFFLAGNVETTEERAAGTAPAA